MTTRAQHEAASTAAGPLPVWDELGLLPPIRPGAQTHGRDRSPYLVPLIDVVRRFGTSVERRLILRGLLRFRAGLHGLGLVTGFQWLDGSFFEDVETSRGRPPQDIDVITFGELGDEVIQQARYDEAPELFDHVAAKMNFGVDNFFFDLGAPMGREEIRDLGYWYSMWSHRREDRRWKGFVEVDLGAAGDVEALALLEALDGPGGAS